MNRYFELQLSFLILDLKKLQESNFWVKIEAFSHFYIELWVKTFDFLEFINRYLDIAKRLIFYTRLILQYLWTCGRILPVWISGKTTKRINEEASTGFDRRGANTRIIYWSSLSRIIIPRGTHFAGKLTDQYLTPTRTASRRERASGRQNFKNAERLRVLRGCCCWWFTGGFLCKTRVSLERVAHSCLFGWPSGCVTTDVISVTC